MTQGTIKTLDQERGFGFILADGESADLYFPEGTVEGQWFTTLRVGQRVEFTVVPDPDKEDRLRAEHVRPIETA